MSASIKLSHYIVRFTLAYLAFQVVAGVISAMLAPDSGATLTFAALIAAVYFSASKFVSDQKRIPVSGERLRLVFFSLLSSLGVSAMLAVSLLAVIGQLGLLDQLPGIIANIGVGTVAAVAMIGLLLYFAVLWFSYGWSAKLRYRAMERKGELNPA
jgi:hypothetical protein